MTAPSWRFGNPHDAEAEITRLKNGRTALGYKAEQAVDMETGAIVAVTAHGGATGDTTSIQETLPTAGEAVANEIATPMANGKYAVDPEGVQEVVTDKGYHSGAVLATLTEWEVRSYVSEPRRGRQKWTGKREQQAAVYANRRRIGGERGKALLRRRGERLERPFAHQFTTGAMRRLHVRGKENVHKKLLLQASAFNLALLLRSLIGAGPPRALQDRVAALLLSILQCPTTTQARNSAIQLVSYPPSDLAPICRRPAGLRKTPGSDTGC